MLESSLAVRSKDIGSDVAFQLAWVESVKLEMAQAQNRAIKLEKLLANFDEQAKNVEAELKK